MWKPSRLCDVLLCRILVYTHIKTKLSSTGIKCFVCVLMVNNESSSWLLLLDLYRWVNFVAALNVIFEWQEYFAIVQSSPNFVIVRLFFYLKVYNSYQCLMKYHEYFHSSQVSEFSCKKILSQYNSVNSLNSILQSCLPWFLRWIPKVSK